MMWFGRSQPDASVRLISPVECTLQIAKDQILRRASRISARNFVILVLGAALSISLIYAQDLSRCREFQLGMDSPLRKA